MAASGAGVTGSTVAEAAGKRLSGGSSSIAVVAFGTRGDVEPLLCLACALARYTARTDAAPSGDHRGEKLEPSAPRVTLLTHESHLRAEWVSGAAEHSGVALRGSACAADGLLGSSRRAGCASRSGDGESGLRGHLGTLLPEEHLSAVVDVVSRSTTVVLNFFALEAWHVAEAVGISAVVASPYAAPQAAPRGFSDRLRRASPALANALDAVRVRELTEGEDWETSAQALVSWRDVELWMHALFARRWAQWRKQALNAPMMPLVAHVRKTGTSPRATPVLCAWPAAVLPRPGYWPPSCHLYGYWRQKPPSAMRRWARPIGSAPASVYAPLCVSLGAMGRQGRLAQPLPLLHTLAEVSARLNRPVLVLASGWTELTATWTSCASCRSDAATDARAGRGARGGTKRGRDAGSSTAEGLWNWSPWVRWFNDSYSGRRTVGALGTTASGSGSGCLTERVFVWGGSVQHEDVLADCAALLHHGGSGTTATAVLCGVPQLTVPCLMDQHAWGECVAHLGVGAAPLSTAELAPPPWSTSWRAVLGHGGCTVRRDVDTLRSASVAIAARVRECLGEAVASACARLREAVVEEEDDALERAARCVVSNACSATMVPAGNIDEMGHAPAAQAGPSDSPSNTRPAATLSVVDIFREAAPEAALSAGPLLWARLSDGRRIRCLAEAETAFLVDEVFGGAYACGCGSLPNDGVVFDVGAHCGLFSVWAADEAVRRRARGVAAGESPPARGGLRIFAFEPTRAGFEALAANVAEHIPPDVATVRLFRMALSSGTEGAREGSGVDAPWREEFAVLPTLPGNSTLARHVAEKREYALKMTACPARERLLAECGAAPDVEQRGLQLENVRVWTIGAVMRRWKVSRIDLLKVDVEGAEEEVLAGMPAQRRACVQRVVMEVHDVGGRVERVVKELRDGWGFAHVHVRVDEWAARVGANNCTVSAYRADRT